MDYMYTSVLTFILFSEGLTFLFLLGRPACDKHPASVQSSPRLSAPAQSKENKAGVTLLNHSLPTATALENRFPSASPEENE